MLDKIQHSVVTKIGIENFVNLIKYVYKNCRANITPHSEKLRAFHKIRNKAKMSPPTTVSQRCNGSLSYCCTSPNILQGSHSFLAVHGMRKELACGHVWSRLPYFRIISILMTEGCDGDIMLSCLEPKAPWHQFYIVCIFAVQWSY